jgi:hypothetical protein
VGGVDRSEVAYMVIDRRAFLQTLVGGLLTAPLAAEAQPVGKIARIGYLTANLGASLHLRDAFPPRTA